MKAAWTEVPVLIVGAGPTGLTLGCDLARRNVDFRIIDKAPAYFAGSRGKGLQPRSLEVFDDLGIVERVVSRGRFHLPFRAYDGAKVLGDRDLYEGQFPTPTTPYASPLIIAQWRTEESLRSLLESHGKKVELGAELIWIEQDEEGVTATVKKGDEQEQVRCQYLVASDGGRSFVRKFLKFGFEGETWQTAKMYVGDVRTDALDRDHWHTWSNHPDGWLALCPLPSTESFQFQAGIPSEIEEEPSLEIFQRIADERTGRADLKFYDPTWLSLYRVNIRMVDRYRNGRVFLAGDAAHVHTPAGGQGMNTGIQDAYNLGWKLGLALAGADAAILDSYEEERLPVAAGVLGISTRLALQFMSDGKQMRRDSETSQLGISYRGSSLSRNDDGSTLLLAAGDRAPDATLLDERGESKRLFDLFRGTHFTLLRIGANDVAGCDAIGERHREHLRTYIITRDGVSRNGALRDDGGHAVQSYAGGGEALALIRPDGYVAWIGESQSVDVINSYLRDVLPVASRAESV